MITFVYNNRKGKDKGIHDSFEPGETGIVLPGGTDWPDASFSNAEMNKMIYQQARDLVDAGVIRDWPENLARIQFHHEKERIPLERDMAGRIFMWHKQSYPEMTNPELCKKDQRYPVLQKAEDMILHTCRQHGVKEEFPTPGRN